VVGVRHALMRAADQPLHAVLQVIKAHGVMTRIAAGRLEPHPGGENVPDPEQAQPIEADKRYLLSELIYGDVTGSEDRYPIDAIDAVVTCRIRAQDVGSRSPPRTSTMSPFSRTSPSRSRRSFVPGL
jgi:hypothetical protein